MSNGFFNATGKPIDGSEIASAEIRDEFTAIAAGFDKLPTLTGNAYEIVYVNASGSAMDVVGGSGLLKLSTTGIPTVAALGTGVETALAVNVGSAGAPVLFNGAGGTPSSMTGTNITGTAAGLTAGVASAVSVGGITGLGTGVATALAVNVGSAGAPVVFNGAGGTPSSMTGTNISGTAAGLTAGAASAVAVGGITGLGTGVATALAVNVGSAGAPVLFNGAGGTPSSMTGTNITGLPTAGLVNNAVTYAKIQKVSATDKLLGRSTAGAGDVEEIACTAAGRAILDDADATAQRATLGLVIGTNVQAQDPNIPTVSASQAEMEAGTEAALRSMSPLRVAQAIAALPSSLTLMTMQASTSGTAKDFTSIPAGVKRITISLSGVSLSGTDQPLFQIGDSGGIEATGYLGASSNIVSVVSSSNYTTGFGIFAAAAANIYHGSLTLTLMDSATNLWAASGVFATSNTGATFVTGGTKALSATLDRVRITSTGYDTFDAGNISVTYEK